MSNVSVFLKANKVKRENVKFAPTKSLCDKDGVPVEFEIQPLSTRDDERIRSECTIEVPVKGKPGMYRDKVDANKYLNKLIAAAIVVPDLHGAELQDSYGVKTPEDLIKEMIDDPGEYNEFAMFVQKFNGFNVSLDEKIDEAKNS